MAIQYNENIHIAAPNPLDKRYLSSRTLAGSQLPYSAITEVNNIIPQTERYLGLTVNVNGVEYWYKTGVTNSSLEIKLFDLSVNNGLIFTNSGTTISLGGNLIGNTSINGLGKYDLSISDINEFQIKSSGNSTVFGVNNDGFLLSFSGGTVSFDDEGGLKYDSDYSSKFTKHSIVDVNFLTGSSTGFLKLNQGNVSGQTVVGKQPTFSEGIILGSNPTLITGHTKGKIYYDNEYQTISFNLNDNVNLQLGQEDLRYVYNPSVTDTIYNGNVVYSNGIYDGNGGLTAAVTTVGLAIATGTTEINVLGISTEDILPQSYGFITSRGHINDLNTLTSPIFSGMSVGDILYLSNNIKGGITNIKPTPPNSIVVLGKLITKHQTKGKIFVQIFGSLRLNNLNDVEAPNPALYDVLGWNGVKWINTNPTPASAGPGVTFYNSTPILRTRTAPAGINSTGTAGNGVVIASLSKIPITTGGTLSATGLANNDTRAAWSYEYGSLLNKTMLEAGNWIFHTYLSVDSVVAGNTYSIRQIYQVVPITSSITISGTGTNNRWVVINSNQFTGNYFSGSSVNTNASWIRITSGSSTNINLGIFQISGVTSNNRARIIVPTGYVNPSGNVSGSTWNKLFGVTSPALTTVHTNYEIVSTQPAFMINETDKLGLIGFISTTATANRIVTATYNGTSQASYFTGPFVVIHNDLMGLQGGNGTQRYHISLNKYNVLENTSGINSGDETKSTIETKLTGIITTHRHPYSGITGMPNFALQSDLVSHSGNSTIHYTQSAITINESQVINLVTDLQNRSLTGHTHSYTGNTIIDKPTFVGSGNTTVNKVGNQYRIYSSADISNANNGLSKVGNSIVLGGALTGNTSLTGNYILNLCNGAKLNSNCGYQISGVTIFDTTRNSLSNIAIGQCALNCITTGVCNVAIGQYALSGNTCGSGNIAIGCRSLQLTKCAGNISIGVNSMINNISGGSNIAIGSTTLNENISGTLNIAIGHATLTRNTTGNWNIAMNNALTCNVSGNHNLGIGRTAGRSNISGSTNIFIGKCAGYNETGSGKLYIGSGNTSLIMGDMTQDCVILPKLKLRTAPTGSGGYLYYNPSTCLVGQTGVTWGNITGSVSSQTDLISCINTKSSTGHTHSYTGNTIINKPTFVGSGDTIVQTVNNEVRIYNNSSSSTIFTENLYVSIASGKTFGKYVNGDTIPSSGKTFADVIKMALNEALAPTLTLNASGSDVSFGQPSKTVNISFSYTINTLNAHVTSVSLEWRRNSEGSWNTLPITTASTSYYHTIDDSAHRFSATTMNYRYTVTDNLGGTNTVYSNVTPAQYVAPTMSPTYTGTIVSPETQTIRELGNVGSTVAGTITSNRSLVNITRYVVERSVNGAAYSTIQDNSVYGTSITISSYVDSSASGSATSIAYRLTVYDEYTTTVGSVYTITFRSMSYFGYNSNTTLTSAQIIALGNTASLASRVRTVTNVTSGVGNYTYITYPAAYGDLTSIKLGGVEEVIGAWSKLTSVNVINSHSQTVSYNVYRSNATNAYTNETLAIS